ncbi:site-specific DNA-methyltransferase [Mesorhizobium sp. M0902]|uniref:DNA-methyltransferase n=1 Tax=Mesorhizobium sp. M0902 TaxID=2957021 RepID=UPI00333DBA8D
MITTDLDEAIAQSQSGNPFVIFNGDCRYLLKALPENAASLLLTSPPYFLGKKFDVSREISQFSLLHEQIINDVVRVLAEGGNICWQVGNHVSNGVLTPLDFVVHGIFNKAQSIKLRNRIVWTFGHGTHAKARFSGRHETALWYSKGDEYFFDLDAARVIQKYPGKKHYKGPKKGEWSSNPKGKNPGDVWDIPNVKANHVEKTVHPCQFPVALTQRLIRALSKKNGLVVDPFAGVASSGIGAILESRMFLGAEIDPEYCQIAEERYQTLRRQTLRVRPLDKPVYQPDPRTTVARDPFRLGGDKFGT